MSTLPDAEFDGPGSWSAADVAGYLHDGVSARVMRQVLARWPHPGDFETAWRATSTELTAAGLPAPRRPWRPAGPGQWLALAGTPEYPTALLATPAPPLVLFGRGALTALAPGLGIVGTRDMTDYGAAVVQAAAAAASAVDVPVHSGGARGCDQAAARAAVTGHRPTVAVLATGPDTAATPEQARMLDAIIDGGGAVVSEHPFGTGTDTRPGGQPPAPIASRLMARNRIISGLSAALVVCEATGRSGTMGAAWSMLGMGRPVIVALPRQHARHLPGAQAPLGLASPTPRTQEQLRAMGAPAAVAKAWAGRAPLASVTATDRDELTAATTFLLRASSLIDATAADRRARAA